MNRRQWAKQISAQWRETAKTTIFAFMRSGELLLEAKADLTERFGHGEFLAMIDEDLPYAARTAQMLMKIANWSWISMNAKHASLLPPDYSTVYQLERLSDRFPETFFRMLEDGIIRPGLQRNEVSKILRLERVAADNKRVSALKPISGKFKTLVVDPPWDYEWLSIGGASKPGYATMSHEELLALDVAQWAEDDCHLYLWSTNNFMTRAAELVQAWGFEHKTLLTWIKTDKSGKVKLGLGTYYRNTTEQVYFAVRGNLGTRMRTTPTHFFGPVTRHSTKPDEFYEIVRRESYLPAGELFSRTERDGFVNVYQTGLREAAE